MLEKLVWRIKPICQLLLNAKIWNILVCQVDSMLVFWLRLYNADSFLIGQISTTIWTICIWWSITLSLILFLYRTKSWLLDGLCSFFWFSVFYRDGRLLVSFICFIWLSCSIFGIRFTAYAFNREPGSSLLCYFSFVFEMIMSSWNSIARHCLRVVFLYCLIGIKFLVYFHFLCFN